MSLNNDIKGLSESCGVNFYGVADLTSLNSFIEPQDGESVYKYPKAVSIGINLPDSIIDKLPRRKEHSVAESYRNTYNDINSKLDIATAKLSFFLNNEGYEALAVPASERYDDEQISAIFSHKLAANLAGLGWIGKSCLLITPKSGPRVRWSTVLTDAPLKVTGEPMPVQCGDCSECVDICPVGAFTGRSFQADEPREVRYDARKCEKYLGGHDDGDEWKVCGLCIYACPHGNKK